MPGRVLIVDPLATNRIVLRAKLTTAYYDTVLAGSGAEALERLAEPGTTLALIAADVADMPGLELCRRIRATHPVGSLPIIMIGSAMNSAHRLNALLAGADAVLGRPVSDTLLLAQIRCLMRGSESLEELRLREGSNRALGLDEPPTPFQRPFRITVMSEDRVAAGALAHALDTRLPHQAQAADGPSLVHGMVSRSVPDLGVVLIGDQPYDPAPQLIAGLRAQPETRRLPIMALTAQATEAHIAALLDLGADDVAPRAISEDELDLRLARLIDAKQRADRLRDTVHDGLRAAVTDALTGLHNRRYALPQLKRMAEESRQTGQGLAVMLADLDHFKSVNDAYGHAVGDGVLQQVAQRLRQALRPGDMLARIGGEEFLIAAPRRSCKAAKMTARGLCRAVASAPLVVPGCPHQLHQTISVGLAMAGPSILPDRAEALMARADHALYAAKTGGRNTVTLAKQTAA
ncbi:diguanylate cyclase [Lutimaribacter sp. EGI FJ00015]|uniref:Diguanylate cyclase n=1 Tax=Lutimaribacter degradans TaxID=2945989 RepID=A0ACC5ZT81_9RHOB|nr:diguanylate cyclase [Lutimaribacter sp. EGI FJ00013]MCM2560754.1 diguanylate cyclase [Lutimaribacter sp. EGI FJ00013]MCO0612300.1 diguanylate cyclase [Lutimaribacter sp. EGI FJ00015]MCO0634579.1 diguanylate cyclase [Lutimaribacter sp. EGI FJ00014]